MWGWSGERESWVGMEIQVVARSCGGWSGCTENGGDDGLVGGGGNGFVQERREKNRLKIKIKNKECNGSHFSVLSFINRRCLKVMCWVYVHGRLSLLFISGCA